MSRKQKKTLLRIGISAVLFLCGLLIPTKNLSLAFLASSYLLIGYDVLKEAFTGILHGQIFDENFLMAIATIGAIIIGEYHEAAAVMLFYQVGEWFQQYAVGKSRASIAELMDICPETAEVERDGELISVDPDEVEIGEIFIVKAGERIPLDGTVVEGSSSLNTAALTGESLPREVGVGSSVLSGCINENGLLRIKAEKLYTDSTVAKILDLVENASDKKAEVENFITRFARFYTPVVCLAALLLFVLPPLFTGSGWSVWGYRALSFLVVSCPCALVISVPLSFFGGIGAASKHGILVKGSNYLEILSKAKTVVFDKTGTLTRGQFSVTDIRPVSCTKDELLTIASRAESISSHPISRCICEASSAKTDISELTAAQEKPGYGVSVVWNGMQIDAGNQKMMESLSISVPDCSGTVVHVAYNQEYMGYLLISDELKPGAAAAVHSLRNEGVTKLVMLTGDNETAARSIGDQLCLDEFHAQLLPGEKVDHVERLLAQKETNDMLVFVGDGINDAPVLARADLGVAMGAMGSDAAVEAADIVLMDDDPRKLSLAVKISRRTLGIVRQNILFALGVKLIVLLLVALGLSGMWLAVFADVGVSVLAILNAMRALLIK
ncbi:MAG: cadmium-translocating P-type ATPase [Clostridia bacterium]|nr:cadmium-translocating P-type ATPase [Clostridia bacterium]